LLFDDVDDLRARMLELVRELGATTIRYPGGNFVSSYKWEDGVGPRAERPVRLDLAWHSTETNEFGTDELLEIYLLLGERSLELASRQGVSAERIETLRAKVAIAKSKMKW